MGDPGPPGRLGRNGWQESEEDYLVRLRAARENDPRVEYAYPIPEPDSPETVPWGPRYQRDIPINKAALDFPPTTRVRYVAKLGSPKLHENSMVGKTGTVVYQTGKNNVQVVWDHDARQFGVWSHNLEVMPGVAQSGRALAS